MRAAIRESIMLQMNRPDVYVSPAIDDESSLFINGVVDIDAVVEAAVTQANRFGLHFPGNVCGCPRCADEAEQRGG